MAIGLNVTVNGDTGDDYINASATNNLFVEYRDGYGNDTVYGFGKDDTLKVSNWYYTTEHKGFDLIVRVD